MPKVDLVQISKSNKISIEDALAVSSSRNCMIAGGVVETPITLDVGKETPQPIIVVGEEGLEKTQPLEVLETSLDKVVVNPKP